MADRSLLARATDGSDAPTPGYLYIDIAKNASASPVACSEIATYLTRRLASKNNHNIKYKCLKVIAKVAESPATRGQFKRTICQDPSAIAAIKEALQFRGPPDPARGDEVYARVRTAAKEALDAVYSDTPTSSEYSGGGSGVSSSYSPSPYSGGGGGVAPGPPVSSGRMQGIGNPMYADPRLEAQNGVANMTIGEVAKEAGAVVANMIRDPLARNIEVGPPQRSSNMPGYGSGGAYGAPPPGRSQLSQSTGGQWTMASNRGPGAVVPPQNYNADRDEAYFKARDSGSNAFQWAQQHGGQAGQVPGGVGGSWANAATGVPASIPSVASQARQPAYGAPAQPTHHAPPTGSGGTAASDGSYERNLVMELCPPGGMKAEPPPDKLAKFARAVPSLNADLVCPALLDCLEDGQPWIIRAKALCVIDTTLGVAEDTTPEGGTNAYSDFFYTCRGEIEPLASHPRSAIKEPAKRVLRKLGLEAGSGAPTPQPGFKPPKPAGAATWAAAAEAPNLLDFDDEPAATPSAPPPAAAPPTEPPADSLFGGLTTKEAKAPAAAPPPPPPPSTPATSASFLGDEAPAAPPPAAPTGGDLFGDMTVKNKPAASNDAIDAAPAANGSAFGFMNANAADAAPSQSTEVVHPPSPSKESFDPLLNLDNVSPNTAKATMANITPAQMQAMAYQQMMMQQQMQMAYALQQQQMGRPMMQVPPGMVMQQQQSGSARNVMKDNSGAAASSPFSFMDAPAPKEDDKKFDFVKDAMKTEGKK